jgi:hypothetical protein
VRKDIAKVAKKTGHGMNGDTPPPRLEL